MFQHESSQLNLKQLKTGEKRWVGNLQGSSAALLIKQLSTQHKQLLIVVARNSQHLGQLESEFEFYGIQPTIFPDWEILPYDRLSPHQDIVSERLAILSNMPQQGVLLVSAATLNMAFSGMRDLSIIATPPARRLAVKTFVQEQSGDSVKEAILRELLRGGQVYFLHNEVDTIERAAENIRQLVPEARVAVAHGQMRERELEQVMQQFYHKEYNVLVCSTIIETGIDVPNANTILIERADKLGLAQLHQLRGRVGRSHHQAYAYLLVPSIKGLKGDAEKRLDAIQRASTLGAGFMLATEDLEIRGAGELLGEQQSGSMQAIGYSLYMEMLEKATKAIQKGKTPNFDAPLSLTAEINLHMPALIPDEYLGDVHQRLLFYKRISNTDTQEKLDNIRMELIDRFGIPPQPVKQLFAVHQLRLKAEQLGITKIDVGANGGNIEFSPDTPVQAISIIQMMQKHPTYFRMDGGQRLKVMVLLDEHQKRIQFISDLLEQLLRELPA